MMMMMMMMSTLYTLSQDKQDDRLTYSYRSNTHKLRLGRQKQTLVHSIRR